MLRIVRDKPNKKGKETPRDANDVFSSFPDAKTERREPTPEEQKKRTIDKKKGYRIDLGTKTKTKFLLALPQDATSI